MKRLELLPDAVVVGIRYYYYYYYGSVHLSMPGHDYVKSGRLAVTDETKPIYIYIYLYLHV